MRIYLDTCCYNRPYDDKKQMKIRLESMAKLHIQKKVHEGKYDLVWSYILDYENKENPYRQRRENIQSWENKSIFYCKPLDEILNKTEELEIKGIKKKDALHISCALYSKCEYFITTDVKLLKKQVDGIKIVNPITFIEEMEE
ncbi:MAG: hypothetical protein LBM96_08700 [Methanobrevibacter sp.]|jgi:hypothetical protein|nr:hypothetical protein [Candidatus Methanoflexus mossambicus]